MGGIGLVKKGVRVLVAGGMAMMLVAAECPEDPPALAFLGECPLTDDPTGCCGDNIDNDGDNHIDCEDKNCLSFSQCIDRESACDDLLDNDADGDIDCIDFDCNGKPHMGGYCEYGQETSCSDGLDNDVDGESDCMDNDCVLACNTETCDNGVDDDGDNDIDCREPACGNYSIWCGIETNCGDHQDNDGDGKTDCDDVGCAQSTKCFGEVVCNDGISNDGDAQVDSQEQNCLFGDSAFYCTTGETQESYKFISSSTAIPDNGSVNLTINIPRTGRVTDAVVVLNIVHPQANTIGIYLTRPGDPTMHDVSTFNGSSGGNYMGTAFEDTAFQPIMSGFPPFYGTWRPETLFSTYVYGVGKTLPGEWTLTIADNASGMTGTVTSALIAFCVDP